MWRGRGPECDGAPPTLGRVPVGNPLNPTHSEPGAGPASRGRREPPSHPAPGPAVPSAARPRRHLRPQASPVEWPGPGGGAIPASERAGKRTADAGPRGEAQGGGGGRRGEGGGGRGRGKRAARTSPPARRRRRRPRKVGPAGGGPAPYHSARACGRQSGGGSCREAEGRCAVSGPPGLPGPPGFSLPRPARPLPAPSAPHPGTIFARSGTAAEDKGRLPVSPRALLSLGFGGRPRGIVGGGGGPPLGRTHTHTHTLGGARTRGDRPRGRGARLAERGGGRSGPGGRPCAREPHGGKAPERTNGSAGIAPTAVGSMARWAALGSMGAGWGGRGALRMRALR